METIIIVVTVLALPVFALAMIRDYAIRIDRMLGGPSEEDEAEL